MNEYIIKFDKGNYMLLANQGNRLPSRRYYFKSGLTWSLFGFENFGVRYKDVGFLFDVSGSSMFPKQEDIYYILAFLASKVAFMYLSILAPTVNFQVGNIGDLPLLIDERYKDRIEALAKENISISREDWDDFEESWDFKKHPFLKRYSSKRLIDIFDDWTTYSINRFNRLKQNEEEINEIFIKIYNLQNDITPEVIDRDIALRKADRERDIKSFISYAVGCMFGRYSLDEEGLIYAGGDFDDKFRQRDGQWEIKTKEGWKKSSINIVEHNVIPIADGDYFEDGILERFVEFVKVSFGEDTLEENLDYIAETLGKRANETSRQAIRRYFLKDFYKDHVRTYKKRPIYWLFDSGRQDGFKALIYMHRYDPSTVARVRTDYLHSLQKKYEAEINHLDILIDSDISQREKAAARKKKEKILKQIEECRLYDEAIAHMANQRIEIDLDDGVKVNYAKFQGVEIPQGKGRKPLKADLLAKI